MKKLNISKKIILNLYENEKFTTFQIAEKIGCCQATIWKRLKEFGISPRIAGPERVKISKKKLYHLYIKNKLSTWKLEEKLRIPRSTIHRKLKEYKIKTRNLSEANDKYPKKDFNGNMIEKSYLIGFRIGDLRVRKQHKNSRTISVGCSSTILEQIDLIRNLFKEYGKIWIKKNKNIIYTEAYLNESFDFLISNKVPNWILKSKKYFFSFLSGFIDAEGSIKIYQNMARFSLGNYDYNLLEIIYKKLNEYEIMCNKPILDKRKGKYNNEGYIYRNNYGHFRIHKKEELLKLLKLIKPYIKHKNRIKDLNKAIYNILSRGIIWKTKKSFM